MKAVILPAARADILHQFRYYRMDQGSEDTAERFLSSVQLAIEEIVRRHAIGTPKIFDHPSLGGLRSWPVKGFSQIRIYYLTSPRSLQIVRVLHGKRDIDRILQNKDDESEA